MEFEVKAEMRSDGTKENSKGGIVSIKRTIYTLVEKRGKDSVGHPMKLRLIVEGTRILQPYRGEVYNFEVSKEQKRLTDAPVAAPIAAPKRSHHKKV